MKWDEWRGSLDGRPTFYSKTLFRLFGWKICIHKFVGIDDVDCYHSHPATALRIVLWGGYVEDLYTPGIGICGVYKTRFAGHISIVRPDFIHRVAGLVNGRNSYSLWIRGPITHKVKLIGRGWERQR